MMLSEAFRQEMEYRGETPQTLSAKTGIHQGHWDGILQGDSIDERMAEALADCWRMSANFWLNIPSQKT